MPLSKEKNRERMRELRHPVQPSVQPKQAKSVQPKVIPGLIKGQDGLYRLKKPVKTLNLPFCEWCQCNHPYNEHIKKLPELDADGRLIPEW